jgi:hypothetical protein
MKRVFLALVLCAALFFSSFPIYAATFDEGVGKEEIPYGNYGDSYRPYKYSEFDMMTSDEAAVAGVPEGYSGYVLKLVGNQSGLCIGLDLNEYRVKDIESITFRVWCPAGTKNNGVRLTDTKDNEWIMLADPGKTESWVEVTLSGSSLSKLDGGNGYCKDTNFCVRYDASSGVAYIDEIKVNLKAPDTIPPVITYNGETSVETTEGKKLLLDLNAYDEYDDEDIIPEYIWSDGAIDEEGLLKKGIHTCTVRATDISGNSSEITIQVTVNEKDVNPPTLSYLPDTVYTPVGAKPVLKVTATDDRDEVDAVLVWSNGALDVRGRLLEGEHTLVVSAEDMTGNKIEKIIKFFVGNTASIGEIIEDTQ